MVESWVIYGIGALIVLGIVNFLVKFTVGKVPPALFLMFYIGTAFFTSVALYLANRPPISFPGNTLWVTLAAGVVLGVGIFLVVNAFNLGLGSKVVTVINMNTLLTVALFVLLLGEKLTPKIGAGILFALVSLYLLTS